VRKKKSDEENLSTQALGEMRGDRSQNHERVVESKGRGIAMQKPVWNGKMEGSRKRKETWILNEKRLGPEKGGF